MSQLFLQTNNFGQFALNVTTFSAPISGSLSSSQTKTKAQIFPIKANQMELTFEVVFPSEQEYEAFQKFVHRTQTNALTSPGPQVRLWWPERNINNWSGLIKEFRAGGMRRNYAPRAKFVVYLIDSLVSQLTQISSLSVVTSAFGGIGVSAADSILKPPSVNAQNLFGFGQFTNLLSPLTGLLGG
jgi:hypothetical protein